MNPTVLGAARDAQQVFHQRGPKCKQEPILIPGLFNATVQHGRKLLVEDSGDAGGALPLENVLLDTTLPTPADAGAAPTVEACLGEAALNTARVRNALPRRTRAELHKAVLQGAAAEEVAKAREAEKAQRMAKQKAEMAKPAKERMQDIRRRIGRSRCTATARG